MKIPIVSFLKSITRIVEENIFCSYNTRNTSEQNLDFSKLHLLQQEAINKMAKDVYASYVPTKWYNKLSCFQKVETEDEHTEVTAFAVYILETIKENCSDSKNIFRFDEKCDMFSSNVWLLSNRSFYFYSTYTAMENATMIKEYLKNGLYGLIPLDVSKILCKAFIKDSKKDFKKLISWFPFVIGNNTYRFLSEAIEMFKEIEKHHEKTLMTVDSLIDEFVPMLFPKEIYRAYPDLDFKELAEHIFSCDYNKVPQINYDKIKDLGKEVVKKNTKKNIKKKW